MVSALFTALALIAAGQGGTASSSASGPQVRSNPISESAPSMPNGDRAVARKARRNG